MRAARHHAVVSKNLAGKYLALERAIEKAYGDQRAIDKLYAKTWCPLQPGDIVRVVREYRSRYLIISRVDGGIDRVRKRMFWLADCYPCTRGGEKRGRSARPLREGDEYTVVGRAWPAEGAKK